MFIARFLCLLLALGAAPAAAAGNPLAGSEWRLVEIGGTPVLSGRRPVMRFQADGKVAGSGGCNRFFGTVTTGKTEVVQLPADLVADPSRRRAVVGEIAFSRIAATKMACPDDKGLEARFFGVLAKAARFQRAYVGLPLKGPDGKEIARYSLTLYDAENKVLARFAWTDWD